MAELVVIGGQTYTKRGPLGAWGLSIITFGIYGLVWYYKINDEARRYLNGATINPTVALFAILFGWILIVPPFISVYRTGERIMRIQLHAGVPAPISPALGLLASLFFALHIPYMQEHLNRVWSQASIASPSPAAMPSSPTTPTPPIPGLPDTTQVPPTPGGEKH
ncbi:MAG: DUF4234 domain-containing protein [Actinomycetota bacterium]